MSTTALARDAAASQPRVASPVASQPFRLASGGLVERGQALRFTFDGKPLAGFAGDTLASALLANGVRLVARSFKYHRPRGILSAGSEEPNALVELRTGARREPNTRATTAELFDGLSAASQNRWPSLAFDLMAVNGLAGPILGAGFYYKTFMWPASFWEKVYEPLIRRAAGLGRAAGAEDPDHYEKAFGFCDLLVIGAGPAGLSAALAAGRTGARVILCDEDFRLGGRLNAERREIGGRDAQGWASAALAELASLPDVTIMPRATVFGVYDGGTYGVVERVSDHLPVPPAHQPRQRSWRIVAKRAVLAAGAIERPLVFPGNDRPGIMLAGAVRTYLNRYGVLPGREAVVYTAGDDGWRSVADLAASGARVAAVIDARPAVSSAQTELARKAGARLVLGGRVIGTEGRLALSAIQVADGAGAVRRIACDLLAVSNGWNPALHLTSFLGHKPRWDEALTTFVPDRPPPGMVVAGAASGRATLAEALSDGARLGHEAATDLGFAPGAHEPVPATDPESAAATPVWRATRHPRSRGKAFVDLQNDVAASDVEIAAREGFRAVELLKRYTTLGMATDQGKTSNLPGLAAMAEVTGRTIPETGTTVFRPPYTPVAIGALAGHHRGREFRPTRLAPTHAWSREAGAVFIESGAWMRAQYYPKPGERDWQESVDREVATVRAGVGFCDVSTLGKIDLQGRDAATFLDRVYCNTFSTLPVGKARYGLMLREDGFVLDDGTTSRLGETHFYVTTTTANAARVMAHMEFCAQVLWPELDVRMVSVSEAWAKVAIAGPRARDTVARLLDPGHDVSDAQLPYMGVRPITLGGGIGGRIFRLSFSGELAYEVAVPAGYGHALMAAVARAGEPDGVVPYGIEALGVLRIEKGHVGGGELNGQTTAFDLGLGRMVSSKKDFIGRLMAGRAALKETSRQRLVGIRPAGRSARLRGGAHILPLGAAADAAHDLGHVTSVAHSPILGSWIGLALVSGGPEMIGERVRAYDPVRGGDIEVQVCQPCFVDPEGAKLHG